jgi:hypothetical protein
MSPFEVQLCWAIEIGGGKRGAPVSGAAPERVAAAGLTEATKRPPTSRQGSEGYMGQPNPTPPQNPQRENEPRREGQETRPGQKPETDPGQTGNPGTGRPDPGQPGQPGTPAGGRE